MMVLLDRTNTKETARIPTEGKIHERQGLFESNKSTSYYLHFIVQSLAPGNATELAKPFGDAVLADLRRARS
jgi:hypothetical protein